MNEAELRRGMGYVIQHAGLFPHRTVLDNIGTVPRLLGWDKKRTRERSRELLERVGLAPELGERYPAQLSGGQQQRVGVARALAADPPVMLMDEPFSAVDPVVREQLQDEFLRLQGELGKTIVFVTHDIDEAIKLGDQVAVLRVGGRLAQVAEPAYLLAHPADDFVADFVGRDRGYRALQFQGGPAAAAALGAAPSLLGEAPTAIGCRRGSSSSTTTGIRWAGSSRTRIGDRAVTEADLHRGGTVAREHGSLRGALDAALSSPSRRGVIVDDAGRCAARCSPHEVLTAIEDTERPERDEADPVHGGARRGPSGRGRAVTWLADNWRTVLDARAATPLPRGRAARHRARRRRCRSGWAAKRWSRSYPAIITSTGLLYTIPSLALFVIMPIVLGTKILDPVNVVVAMTIYTVALLVRTVADGLKAVPDNIEQAATAMGYRGLRRLFGVELPLAVPVIASGLRVAAGQQRQHRQRRLADRRQPARRPARRRLQPGHLGRARHRRRCRASSWRSLLDGVIVLGHAAADAVGPGAGRPGMIPSLVVVVHRPRQLDRARTASRTALLQHLEYTAVALVIAAAIAIPLGLWVGHTGRARWLVSLANSVRAVPTLGLLFAVALWLGPRISGDLAFTHPEHRRARPARDPAAPRRHVRRHRGGRPGRARRGEGGRHDAGGRCCARSRSPTGCRCCSPASARRRCRSSRRRRSRRTSGSAAWVATSSTASPSATTRETAGGAVLVARARRRARRRPRPRAAPGRVAGDLRPGGPCRWSGEGFPQRRS